MYWQALAPNPYSPSSWAPPKPSPTQFKTQISPKGATTPCHHLLSMKEGSHNKTQRVKQNQNGPSYLSVIVYSIVYSKYSIVYSIVYRIVYTVQHNVHQTGTKQGPIQFWRWADRQTDGQIRHK